MSHFAGGGGNDGTRPDGTSVPHTPVEDDIERVLRYYERDTRSSEKRAAKLDGIEYIAKMLQYKDMDKYEEQSSPCFSCGGRGSKGDGNQYPEFDGWTGWIREQGGNSSLIRVLSALLAVGEFLLLLLALLTLLEISPADIPARCDDGTYVRCMTEFSQTNGSGWENDFGAQTCGRLTVDCWRGDYQELLFNSGNAPPPTWQNKLVLAELGLDDAIVDAFGAPLTLCHCLLTRGHAEQMPQDKHAWRRDTPYFCQALEEINSLQGGIAGIVIAMLVLAVRGYITEMGETASHHMMHKSYIMILLAMLLWCGWSASIIEYTMDHQSAASSEEGNREEPPCELPESQIFYYLNAIALLSLLVAFLCIVVVLIIMWFRIERNKPSNRNRGHIFFGCLKWMGDDQIDHNIVAQKDYLKQSLARLRYNNGEGEQTEQDTQPARRSPTLRRRVQNIEEKLKLMAEPSADGSMINF